MSNWKNLGKKRAPFGEWMDARNINQKEIIERSEGKISGMTVSRLCNDENYKPKYSTVEEIKKSLNKMGHTIDTRKFWGI